MGNQIDRTGTFRGGITDFGLATTKNAFPQLIVALHAEEYYDEDEKKWVSWEGVEEADIMAYLVLFGTDKKPVLNLKQVQKALDWDGLSFVSLLKIDWQNIKIQWRVETHLFNETTTLRVNWVDAYGAEPGRTIVKLTDDEVKKLDTEYAVAFKKNAGGQQQVKPVSASDLPWTKPEIPKSELVTTTPPKPPKKKTVTKPGCTLEEAWKECSAAKAKSITEDKLAEIWVETVMTLAPDNDQEKMTPDLWLRVKEIVSTRVKDDLPF